MNRILEETYLFDFYGDLLTPHQRQIYEQAVLEDLSLGEVAENFGISRQAVHDLLKRSKKTLAEHEEKLHLIDRFVRLRTLAEELNQSLSEIEAKEESKEALDRARTLAGQLTEEL